MSAKQGAKRPVSLEDLIAERQGQSPLLCYQCGECTAGCPMAPDMDLSPNQVIRMVQIGAAEEALRSKSIWFCASCQTCTTRCPQGFDIAKFMDVLREMSLQRGMVHRQAKPLVAFHRSFLDTIRYGGKAYEMGLVMLYKLRTGRLFEDITLAPAMRKRGKMHLLPDTVSRTGKWRSFLKKMTKGTEADS